MQPLYSFPALADYHYFDYAATTCMPEEVLQAWLSFQHNVFVSTDRGTGALSARAEEVKSESIRTLHSFFSLGRRTNWMFSKNVTEAINLTAQGLEKNIEPMDYIAVGPFEHHSNFLPWRYLAKRTDAVFIELPTDRFGRLDLDYLELIGDRIKVFSYSAVANTNGYSLQENEVFPYLRKDAIVCCDLSQQQAHESINLNDRVNIAFLTSHKMYGPKNIAAAVFDDEIASRLSPVLLGGGMVDSIGLDDFWADGDRKYNAGTIDVGLIAAWSEATRFMERISFESIAEFEQELFRKITGGLSGLKHYSIISSPDHSSIISFVSQIHHPHDIKNYFDSRGIVIRSGNLCSQNSIRKYDQNAINRISLGIGIRDSDVSALLTALEDLDR